MTSVTLYRFEEINKQFYLADACGMSASLRSLQIWATRLKR